MILVSPVRSRQVTTSEIVTRHLQAQPQSATRTPKNLTIDRHTCAGSATMTGQVLGSSNSQVTRHRQSLPQVCHVCQIWPAKTQDLASRNQAGLRARWPPFLACVRCGHLNRPATVCRRARFPSLRYDPMFNPLDPLWSQLQQQWCLPRC